jgi:hypothetical protein
VEHPRQGPGDAGVDADDVHVPEIFLKQRPHW